MKRDLGRSRFCALAGWLGLALAAGSVPAAAEEAGESVNMQRVRDADPALRSFARQYIQGAAYWSDLQNYQSEKGRRFALERDILVGEADLNDDGLTERFITIENPLFCGRSGCTTYVLQKQGRAWRPVLQNNVRADIRVLDETDGGYHRLCMARLVEAWDGRQYEPIPSGQPAAPPAKPGSDDEDLSAYVTCDDGDTGRRD